MKKKQIKIFWKLKSIRIQSLIQSISESIKYVTEGYYLYFEIVPIQEINLAHPRHTGNLFMSNNNLFF